MQDLRKVVLDTMEARGLNPYALARKVEFEEGKAVLLQNALYRLQHDAAAGLSMKRLAGVLWALGLEVKG